MSDSLLQQLFFSLLGGLIGAVIGVLGTIYATRSQIKALSSQEKENRKYAEEQQDRAMKHALLVEIEENLKLAQSLAIDDAKNVLAKPAWEIYKGKNILTSEAWEIYKGNITKLSNTLQTKLLEVYIEVKKYNSLIEYERRKIRFGDVQLNPLIEEQAEKVVSACEKAIKELPKD